MGRILKEKDVEAAVKGGSVYAAGGGGWADHGRMLGYAAVSIGKPELVSIDELSDDDWVATAAAIGAPAGLQGVTRPVTGMLMFGLVARFGTAAMAALTKVSTPTDQKRAGASVPVLRWRAVPMPRSAPMMSRMTSFTPSLV